MMKTFQEFLDEGKKANQKYWEKQQKETNKAIAKLEKELRNRMKSPDIVNQANKIQKEVEADVKHQRQEHPHQNPIAHYGGEAGSDERLANIKAMMDRDSAWRKEMKRRQSSK